MPPATRRLSTVMPKMSRMASPPRAKRMAIEKATVVVRLLMRLFSAALQEAVRVT